MDTVLRAVTVNCDLMVLYPMLISTVSEPQVLVDAFYPEVLKKIARPDW